MQDGYLTTRHLRLPDGSFPHLGVGDGEVAPVALLAGSPARVELMAKMLAGAERVGDRRGYAVYTGRFEGAPVTVATSGVGAPSLSIAVEELGACGVRTFIRVGSCAAIHEDIPVGGLAIIHAAVSDEGTSRYYAPSNYPPVASPAVVASLIESARSRGHELPVGVSRSTDSFYEGERKTEIIDQWRRLGLFAFDMETSALFTVSAALGWQAGSIVVAGTNLLTGEATYQGDGVDEYAEGQEEMLNIALQAAGRLSAIA